MPRRLTAPTSPAWTGDLPVFEGSLANGLKTLVLPRPHSPVVVCDLFYPVGSVDEPAGRSGLAHFVEHMLFKGTERFPKGEIDRLAFLAAGQANAETGEDSTHYWFAFPRDRWQLALELESDRMRHAVFDPREVEAERLVIAEERARDLDSPVGRLEQAHLFAAYTVHPYRNPVLGLPEDLGRLTPDDLRAFYEAHYSPDRAVLVVVGDLDPGPTFDQVAERFGAIARVPRRKTTEIPPPEPTQTERREFALVEPETAPRGLLVWHTVPWGRADSPVLDVLADLLACGRRSRLWDRLVETERVAVWVDAAHDSARLAGRFLIQVEMAPVVDPARVERLIARTIQELADAGPTPAELARSRRRLEASWRWEQEDQAGLAGGLGHYALWGDWRVWPAEHRAAMGVTADDIRRVASQYLRPDGLTVGWSLSRAERRASSGAELPRVVPPPPRPVPPHADIPVPAVHIPARSDVAVDFQPRRTTLPNGLRLFYEPRPGTGTVALELYSDSGQLREAKPGLAYLTGRLREEGTRRRSAERLAEEVEDLGGSLDVGATGVSLRVPAEELAIAVELLADVTLNPAFPEDALPWIKTRTRAELRADRDDPSYRAETLFRRLAYGDHPYARDPRGSTLDLGRVALADIRRHHRRHVIPRGSFLIAVGDFHPAALRKQVARQFGSWSDRGVPGSQAPVPVAGRRARRRVVTPGEQVHILIGHLGVARRAPDYDALLILDHILGSGPGFTDRLSRTLRDELGLAYAVGGGMTDSADVLPGLLRIYVGTGPEEADRAVAAVESILTELRDGRFTDEEVDRARRYLAGSWVFDYQTVTQRAERLFEIARWGLDPREPKRFPDRISAVSAESVRAAARRRLHPEALVRVVLGPASRGGGIAPG